MVTWLWPYLLLPLVAITMTFPYLSHLKFYSTSTAILQALQSPSTWNSSSCQIYSNTALKKVQICTGWIENMKGETTLLQWQKRFVEYS